MDIEIGMHEGVCVHVEKIIEVIKNSRAYINAPTEYTEITIDCDSCKVYAFLWKHE